MRGQQVLLRERIPNTMFVTLLTYFYVGARMLNYSRKNVVYTNTDRADDTDAHGSVKIRLISVIRVPDSNQIIKKQDQSTGFTG